MKFEWDPVKAASNARKHKVTFEMAKTVFYDDFAVQFFDEEHTRNEERFLLLGMGSDHFMTHIIPARQLAWARV